MKKLSLLMAFCRLIVCVCIDTTCHSCRFENSRQAQFNWNHAINFIVYSSTRQWTKVGKFSLFLIKIVCFLAKKFKIIFQIDDHPLIKQSPEAKLCIFVDLIFKRCSLIRWQLEIYIEQENSRIKLELFAFYQRCTPRCGFEFLSKIPKI